jgi:hypothetical protein
MMVSSGVSSGVLKAVALGALLLAPAACKGAFYAEGVRDGGSGKVRVVELGCEDDAGRRVVLSRELPVRMTSGGWWLIDYTIRSSAVAAFWEVPDGGEQVLMMEASVDGRAGQYFWLGVGGEDRALGGGTGEVSGDVSLYVAVPSHLVGGFGVALGVAGIPQEWEGVNVEVVVDGLMVDTPSCEWGRNFGLRVRLDAGLIKKVASSLEIKVRVVVGGVAWQGERELSSEDLRIILDMMSVVRVGVLLHEWFCVAQKEF